jgi:glutathione gamma-glutamylcysteinyltransferase
VASSKVGTEKAFKRYTVQDGLTMDQVQCLAKCNCSAAELHRHGTFSLEQLRQEVAAVTASGTEHIIATYSRQTLKQTGDGHFSPIGGFHPGRDLVLILDTGAAVLSVGASNFS